MKLFWQLFEVFFANFRGNAHEVLLRQSDDKPLGRVAKAHELSS